MLVVVGVNIITVVILLVHVRVIHIQHASARRLMTNMVAIQLLLLLLLDVMSAFLAERIKGVMLWQMAIQKPCVCVCVCVCVC